MHALRAAVASEALSWAGTPYVHRARIKGAGVDCAQILVGIYGAVGLVDPLLDVGDYPIDFHLHRGDEIFLSWAQRFGVQTLEPDVGDLALYRFGRVYSHGAVLVTKDDIVHAVRKAGKVIAGRRDGEHCGGRPVVYFTFKEFST